MKVVVILPVEHAPSPHLSHKITQRKELRRKRARKSHPSSVAGAELGAYKHRLEWSVTAAHNLS